MCVSSAKSQKKPFQLEKADSGSWEGEFARWLGCVCKKIHPPPVEVFWIRCDGVCGSWYNVSPSCVGMDTSEVEQLPSWRCNECEERYSRLPSAIRDFLELPDQLLYKILQFTAKGPEMLYTIRTLSLVCSVTNHAVHGNEWKGVWGILSLRECGDGENYARPQKRSRRKLFHHTQTFASIPPSPKDQVQDYFISLCQRTEDAHMALTALLDSNRTPLSVERLRKVLDQQGGVMINRRSQAGRTFLHECCTADYVDARVVHRCVQELLTKYNADPNVLTSGDANGNRPTLFFAISRLMPSVTEALIQAGANLKVKVTGNFGLVSNPEQTFSGTFTPLEFARRLMKEEDKAEEKKATKSLSPYWRKQLRECVAILSTA